MGPLGDARHDLGCGLFHAAAQHDRAGAGSHVSEAFADQCLGQQGGSGGAVAGGVLGLAGHLLHQLGANVFEGIFEFDLPGDGDAVINDLGRAEFLFEHHVAAAGSDGDLHGVGQGVYTTLKGATGGI